MAEQQLPVWNSKGVEPPANLQRDGWQPGVKPPAQYFDWLFNRAYECLEELQAITEALETNKANGTELTTLNNKVTQHLDDYTKSPVTYNLSTPVGLIGEISYKKGANNLTEVYMSLSKTTAFVQNENLILGNLPLGYRPAKNLLKFISFHDSNGNDLPNSKGVILFTQEGLIRIIDAGSGTVNAATIMDNRHVNTASDTFNFGAETVNNKNDYSSMSRGIIRNTTKLKWNKSDKVLICGGISKGIAPYIIEHYPNAEILNPVFKSGNEVKILDAVFANATGFYKIAKGAYE